MSSTSIHRKSAVKLIKTRYSKEWTFLISPIGVELRQEVSEGLIRHLHFNFVRDDEEGLRVQPALALTFSEVNKIRDRLVPRHEHTIDANTACVFINDLVSQDQRKNGGWLFRSGSPLTPDFDNFLNFVDRSIQDSGFFDSIESIENYVSAVRSGKWSFLSIYPAYLYALIYLGDVEGAKNLAKERRGEILRISSERGFVVRAEDTLAYDSIISMNPVKR